MKQYIDLVKQVQEHGVFKGDRTGVGTQSYFGPQMDRIDLSKGFPLLTTKKLPLRWIFEELNWFIHGNTDEAVLAEKGVTIWKEWADEEHCAKFGREPGDLGPIYGYLWRSFGGNYPERDGVDQLKRLIDDLKNKRDSRRHIISGWDPQQCDNVTLPPCHTLFQMYVDPDDRLSCKLYQRSADLFLGVPYNIASYALFTHMIAHVCGYKPGEFVHTFGDCHIYNNHVDQFKIQLEREPYPLPKLVINPEVTDIEDFKWSDITLEGYKCHGVIKAPVAV